ncbi:MAG: PT domain-containing protein [Chloroflexota bacterium]|nr:PT domain-containing protein [Chloroflexota bacterium]
MVAAAAMTLAVVNLGGAFNVRPSTTAAPPQDPSRTPTVASSVEPTADPTRPATAAPTTGPDARIELTQTVWYDIVGMYFGTLTGPEASPVAGDSESQPYSLLRVGTLDGRVVAEIRLAIEAFANGPFGADVLVGEDDGSNSSLMLVSALDGSTRELFTTSDLVVRAALSPDGDWVYYVPVDRTSATDRGLWRWSLDSGRQEPVTETPMAAARNDYASIWQMRWSPGGDYLVTQICRLRACRQLVHRPADGMTRLDDDTVYELLGVTDAEYVVRSYPESEIERGGVLAVDLAGGGAREVVADMPGYGLAIPGGEAGYLLYVPDEIEVRAYRLISIAISDGSEEVLVDLSPEQPNSADIFNGEPGDSGASLPAGWVLRWPPSFGGPYPETGIPPHEWFAGELINVVTGDRMRVPPFMGTLAQPGCAAISPSELPSGARPGEAIETYGGPFRWATWGEGRDQVVQVIGGWPYGNPGAAHTPVTVRGLPGWVHGMGNSDGPYAIMWQETDCLYEARLAPDGTLEQAIEYASRY